MVFVKYFWEEKGDKFGPLVPTKSRGLRDAPTLNSEGTMANRVLAEHGYTVGQPHITNHGLPGISHARYGPGSGWLVPRPKTYILGQQPVDFIGRTVEPTGCWS